MFVNSKKISIKTSFLPDMFFWHWLFYFRLFRQEQFYDFTSGGKNYSAVPLRPKTQTQFSYTDHFIKKEMTSSENFFPCMYNRYLYEPFWQENSLFKENIFTQKTKTDWLYCTIVLYICICSLFTNKYSISEWNGVQIHSTGFVESCLTFLDELFAYKCYCRLEIKSDLCIRVYPHSAAGRDCSERAMFSQLSF